jgi:LacI family transcriptional regulator
MSDESLHTLSADRPRMLCVNRIPAGVGLPALAYDSYSPMLEICGLLERLGHRRVVYLAGPEESWVNGERWRAVENSGAFGLEPVRVQAGYTIDEGYAATDAALQHDPSALVASNDLCAVGVLTRLRELGLRVPEDLSLTGFDDIPFSRHTLPPLTTARIPRQALGERAWALMRSILAGKAVPPGQPLMPAEIVVRASTGPARPPGSRRGRR